jgi:hypothetical protein
LAAVVRVAGDPVDSRIGGRSTGCRDGRRHLEPNDKGGNPGQNPNGNSDATAELAAVEFVGDDPHVSTR